METIFDHNITKEEIEEQFGYLITKDEYFRKFKNPNVILAHLYELFCYRKDEAKAKKYAKQIPDSDNKIFCLIMSDF